MNISRFQDRVGVLDERSRRFLTTVTSLGGYVTPEQAQELGIRDSVPRVHVQLKDLESCGFIKRIGSYPAIYQVTKSVARIMGADFSARRRHAIETIRTRILTVNFYLEALRWPVEFVFNHGRKLSKFGELGCESGLLPQRGGKPYLWQDFVLQRRSGGLAVAMVDHFGRSAQRQLDVSQLSAKELELIHQFARAGEGEVSAKHFSGKFQREYFARLVEKTLLIRTGRGQYKLYHTLFREFLQQNPMKQRPQKREPSAP